MKHSLFQRLYRAQATDRRENLENFLTEMLCDSLNRMGLNGQKKLLYRLFKNEVDILSSILPLNWESQYSIPWDGSTKYIDLIGFSSGVPVILIECKIGASFTQHHSSGEDFEEDTEILDQLTVYGRWLYTKNTNAVLVLLTKNTPPPPGFIGGHGTNSYGVSHRSCISWQDVYEAHESVKNYPLTQDIQRFMESQGVAMDQPTRNDFSILELYLSGPADRVSAMMEDLRNQLKSNYGDVRINWGKEASYQQDGFQSVYDDSVIWGWAFLKEPLNAYIAWGFHFPNKERSGEWHMERFFDGAMPNYPYLFVGAASDFHAGITELQDRLDATWMKADGVGWNGDFAAIKVRPLYEILNSENVRESCMGWVNELFGSALSQIATPN